MKTALLLIVLFLVGCSDKPSLADKLKEDPKVFQTLPAATQIVLLMDIPIMFLAVGALLAGCALLTSAERKK
jgi:PBP1b-binding outer membrane lipoprotein LpoB